jgi:3-deoxy-D-manno-octulosonic-acid transferase
VASRLSEWRQNHPGKLIWIHCSSLGEFEQGRPVIEAIKKEQSERSNSIDFFLTQWL